MTIAKEELSKIRREAALKKWATRSAEFRKKRSILSKEYAIKQWSNRTELEKQRLASKISKTRLAFTKEKKKYLNECVSRANRGKRPHNYMKSYESLYGKEKAYLIKNKIRNAHLGKSLSAIHRKQLSIAHRSRSIEAELIRKQKAIKTKQQNRSFNVSKPEMRLKKLLESIFKDVQYQYTSDKYPFACDFYIPELDLYIEYQGMWTHGSKPFEGTPEDLQKVELWRSKNTKFYNIALNTWTVTDPLKRKVAKQNNLNWLEFFTEKAFIDYLQDRGFITG